VCVGGEKEKRVGSTKKGTYRLWPKGMKITSAYRCQEKEDRASKGMYISMLNGEEKKKAGKLAYCICRKKSAFTVRRRRRR